MNFWNTLKKVVYMNYFTRYGTC